MKDRLNRREFMQRVSLFFAGALGAGTLLSACGGGEKQPQQQPEKPVAAKPADPCADLSGLTEQDKQMRQTFQYVALSEDPNKNCSNCSLFTAPAEGASCGTCQVIKGPINPKGHCTAWAPKQG